MMWAIVAISATLFLVVALAAWWKFLGSDREGIDPTNHIAELNQEDGGPGPIP